MSVDSQFRKTAQVGATLLVVLGIGVLFGWMFDLGFLTAILPGRVTMKANAAVAFLSAGVTLMFLRRPFSRPLRYVSFGLSGIVLVIGASAVAEYLLHLDFKIDQLFFADHLQFPFPGRLAPITAINFCVAGLGLLLLHSKGWRLQLAQLLAAFVGLSALLAVIGYFYGVPLLYGSFHYTSMALHTGGGFLLLSLSMLGCRPNEGFMSVVTSMRSAGWLARRLLAASVLLPFVFGFSVLHVSGFLSDSRFMVAALVIGQIVIFTVLIWVSATRLHVSEGEEELTKQALATSEQMLWQAQKLEAIGLLAGGVAHDFNNLLNVIVGYSELLLGDSSLAEHHRSKIAKIEKAGQTATALTRQLLAFSRQQVLQPKVLDLNQIIGNPDGYLHRLVKEDIQMSTALDPGLMATLADPTQVEQILLNLVINACDAMPQGGKLHLETENVVLEEPFSAKTGVLPGPFVRLTITDTGSGMDEETRSHIFEPFFTTKPVGKGTGLGLATVYGIVKQSGGYIEVESKVGRGTTFFVYLPASRAPLSQDAPKVSSSHDGGGATILVVEDSAPLRDLIFETLESMGYTALMAEDGQQAIRLCNGFTGTIDLLLTDVIMPRMNGPEVMKKVKGIRPDIAVMFMSGYTSDVTLRHGISGADVSFLQKPFSSTQLMHKLRETLARARDRHTVRHRLGLEKAKRSGPLSADQLY